ncbi:hypothetical protein OS493_019311 [Desmophyllum pertusum]|uniref:Uncharacterized protein n=1 Tax=Desmophyllum pertusum TaxID=174260 RepID=A0A9X0A1B3_9CNID|nr:hypothetical protein OS493_019311 [Desmophyllum pertusum]
MKEFQNMFEGEDEPTIRLRFAGDRRRTSKKIGTVMAVFSVLREGIHKPDYQYNTCLYNGKEGHEQLTSCMKSIFQEMKDLERNGLDYNGRHFKIEWLVHVS